MTDNDPDRPITFNEACRFLPEGSRPSYATWWRWWRKGIKGIRLHTVVCGGRRYTTAMFVQKFFSEVTAAASGEPVVPTTRTPRQREQAIREAERQLANDHFKTRST